MLTGCAAFRRVVFIQLGVHFLHAVHDDADEEVEHDHRAKQDEADEIDRGDGGGRALRADEQEFPIVEGDRLEKRQESPRQAAEVFLVVTSEEMHAGDGVDVEHDSKQQAYITHRAETFDQRANQELKLG